MWELCRVTVPSVKSEPDMAMDTEAVEYSLPDGGLMVAFAECPFGSVRLMYELTVWQLHPGASVEAKAWMLLAESP